MISPVKCCASAALPPLPKVYRMPRRSNARQSSSATALASGSRAAAASPVATWSESWPAIQSVAVGTASVGPASGIGGLLIGPCVEQVEGDGAGSDGAHLVAQ